MFFRWLRPIFTYNYTKNNFIRTKKLLFNCALILPLLVLILLIPLIFFKNILNLFVHDLNMIDTARRILNSYIFIIPLLLFKGIIFVYLQSIAKKLKLAVIYISNMLLLIVPLYIMWRFHIEIEFNGWLFLNIVIASLMFIISLIFFITELKSLKNKTVLYDNTSK
ncbi:MATE family efflux transporter [Halocella sp. SP3-1]|uniref:MATE family efflux transporter n=1 Tax=Halocella sp. SP3-1 TaxID=2382161 RepID=UPI0013DE956E